MVLKAAPGNLLVIQILASDPRPPESDMGVVLSSLCVLRRWWWGCCKLKLWNYEQL